MSRKFSLGGLGLILIIGFLLRILVIYHIPYFYGPGDPATYYEVARNIYLRRGAVVDYIWHFLSLPDQITHYEDYYEPLYPLLLAGWFCIAGESVISAKILSAILGTFNILLIYFLTKYSFDQNSALLAALLASFHPSMIYYSGVIRKETLIATLHILLFMLILKYQTQYRPYLLVSTGLLAGIISTTQYESLAILPPFLILTFYRAERHKYKTLLIVLAAFFIGILPVMLWNILNIKVPFGYKYRFFFGGSVFTPNLSPESSFSVLILNALKRLFLLPIGYFIKSTLKGIYPLMLCLGIFALLKYRRLSYCKWFLLFIPFYFYIHMIPKDLYFRDYIVILSLLIPIVANYLNLLSKRNLVLLFILGLFFEYHIFCITEDFTKIPSFKDFFSLPYQQVMSNFQFPWYMEYMGKLEKAGKDLKAILPPNSVIFALDPWEIHYYSDIKAVMLPRDLSPQAIEFIYNKYRPTHSFVVKNKQFFLVDHQSGYQIILGEN